MELDLVLARADEEALQDILGQPTVRLLRSIDPQLASQARLRNLVVDMRTREGLLVDPQARRLLFALLRPEWAQTLAQQLTLPTSNGQNAFAVLDTADIRRGSQREEALFRFFDLVPPPTARPTQTPESQLVSCDYSLFKHQRRAVRAIHPLLEQEPRRALLHMPTGAGKTRTTMHIIANHLRQTEPTLVIWLAYSEELCEQAATEFERAWSQLGDREIPLYRFWGNRSLDPATLSDGLLVAGLAKTYQTALGNLQFISRLSARCSLVIIDEAHQAIAQTYQLVLDTLILRPETALLGLTATPGRTWNNVDADRELANFFARKKVTLSVPGYDSPIDFLVAEGYLAKVKYRSMPYRSGITLSQSDLDVIERQLELPSHVLKRLAEDEQRNMGIIAEVEKLARRHTRILVFAISVEHSQLLASVLRARGLRAASVTGNTPSTERANLIRRFKSDGEDVQILCNYGVLTTGFDAPRTSAAVIARPTHSLVLFSQMVGRAIRGTRAGGNAEAEIITVVDTDLPGFKSVADAFNNWEDVWE